MSTVHNQGRLQERGRPGIHPRSSKQVNATPVPLSSDPSSSRLERPAAGNPYFLIAAFFFMGIALLFSNPPGASPDETAHYLRAMGAGRGQFILPRPGARPPGPPQLARQMTWMWMQSGIVKIPQKHSAASFECWARPLYVGNCPVHAASSEKTATFTTYVGSYPPFTYVAPGLLMRATEDPRAALILGRAGSLLTSLALIAAAVLAIRQRANSLWPVGLLLTVTPMVLFTAGSLSSSGVEIAAAICFFACLLNLTRSDTRSSASPAWVWTMAAVSGAILAVARDLGPVWVVLHLGLAGIFGGWDTVRVVWSRAGKRAWILAGATLASLTVALAWRAVAAVPPDLSRLRPPNISITAVRGLVLQVVGVFGPLDAPMPDGAYHVWGLMSAILLLSALLFGTVRQRFSLLIAILAAASLTYVLEAAQNIYGFGVQARHVMPVVILIPLLAGETVGRSHPPKWMRAPALMPATALAVAGVQFTAWYTVGRRFAVGPGGPVIFFRDPLWSPPGGWITWGTVMVLGCGALVLAFLLSRGKEPDPAVTGWPS